MNTRVFASLLTISLAYTTLLPLAAQGQTTVLDYSSAELTGTYAINTGTNPNSYGLEEEPFEGNLTAQLTLSGTQVTGLSFGGSLANILTGEGGGTVNNYASLYVSLMNAPEGLTDCTQIVSFSAYGCVTLAETNGHVTQASIDLIGDYPKGAYVNIVIGPTGDSFSQTGDQLCNFYQGSNPFQNCGPTLANTTAGTWSVVSAPEIDASSQVAALTLLIGVLLILQTRRQVDRGQATAA